ncbi:MAG: N-acetylgalactosamine-6-sulfatase, partial [Cyclobacteriaceae bacterium]
EFMYWEFHQYGGQVALRMGDWKFMQRQLSEDEPTVELYNLAEDIQESNNVADQNPEIVLQAQAIINREHESPELETFTIPVLEAGLNTTK